jgi:phage shock protein A
MQFLELLLLRLFLWLGLPLLLLVLALGPVRVWNWLKDAWIWLWEKRLDPRELLTRVVRQQQQRIAALRKALQQAEAAEADILSNSHKSEENITNLEKEAHRLAARYDDLGARAALYKLNLERVALESFNEQLKRQRRHITEARRRLYLLELQLRQYEVGRTILLSQLADAQTVEQQYAIASHFDPFHAVANWQKAEGLVQEKAVNARAVEQVFTDTAEMPLAHQPAQVDPATLDAQLAELKRRMKEEG